MLIATLPSAEKKDLIDRIFSNPFVDGARYNVGIRCPYDTKKSLEIIKNYSEKYGKKLWIDLKGRQLRITRWADPTYGDIRVSHEIDVELPAKIVFRGGHETNVTHILGNRLYVNPNPKEAIGEGQAVNILGKGYQIKGDYLTEKDKEYILEGKKFGINNLMLSFVEKPEDIEEAKKLNSDAELIIKIENINGLNFVNKDFQNYPACQLMAARDDLFINIGQNKFQMIKALELILEKDKNAIVASHIFGSLNKQDYISMADVSDLELLRRMGYKNFMFSDEISHRHFDKAIEAWKYFVK